MNYVALRAALSDPSLQVLDDAAAAAKLNAITEPVPPPPYDPVAEDAFYSAVERQVARNAITQEFADELIAERVAISGDQKAKKRSLADVLMLGEAVSPEHIKYARTN